jgi:hypothetical protein
LLSLIDVDVERRTTDPVHAPHDRVCSRRHGEVDRLTLLQQSYTMTIDFDYESTEDSSPVTGSLYAKNCHGRTVMRLTAWRVSPFIFGWPRADEICYMVALRVLARILHGSVTSAGPPVSDRRGR